MAIIKPNEIVQTDFKVRMLIAGHPGIGKTTFALSAPKPLLIDIDQGVRRVHASHRKDTIIAASYNELLNDLKKEDLTDYETIVIDTGGALFNFMKPYVIACDAKNGRKDGNLSIQGYGVAGKEFARIVDYCHMTLKKHLVVVFHAKEEKDRENTILRILVEGQTKDNIWQPMDIGGFIEMNGNDRIISFENNERHYAKATHGIPLTIPIPRLGYYDQGGKWVVEKENDTLTKLFEQIQQNLKQEAETFELDKKAYEQLMDTMLPQIQSMTEETFPEVSEMLKNANHMLTSKRECADLYKKRMAVLGYVWDKETRKYVPDNSKST